jgi:hypothetical protein
MSGHKKATISIREDEYRRLHEAEMKLRFMPRVEQDTSFRDDQLLAAIQDQVHQFQLRQDEFYQLLAAYDRNSAIINGNTAEAINAYQIRFSEEISNAVGNLANKTEILLAVQAANYEKLLANERQQRLNEIQAIQYSVSAIETALDRKVNTAAAWIDRADELMLFIIDHYDHDLFAPGEVEQCERSLLQARMNISEGMPEAALVLSQQVFYEFCDLRVELERKLSEWNTLYQTVWEGVAQLIDAFNQFRTCSAHDLDGNELPFNIDVDFWSSGAFKQAESQVYAILQRIDEPGITANDLRDVLHNELPHTKQRLEAAIFDARLAVLNSQLRINIADLVIHALQTQGYHLQQAEYTRDDQRMAYSAKVQNYEGNEIVIQVYPSDRTGKNELHLVSLDRAQRTEHELRQRSIEVTRSLSQHGLVVDQLQVIGKDHKKGNRQPTPLKQVVNTATLYPSR